MIQDGQIVLLSFPQSDQAVGKLAQHSCCAGYQVPMTTGLSA
jgi:hypothetical protein